MTENKKTIETPNKAYNDMQTHWPLIDDLMGGTLAMRAAGTTWLPQEPKEKPEAYQNRLKRSILFTAYSDTVEDLKGKPFSKPVMIQGKEKFTEQLAAIAANCDGLGTDITQFAKELFTTGCNRGVFHVLVDYPAAMSLSDGKPLTLADEKRLNLRPYFILIRADQLISWRSETTANGQPNLTQIVWISSRTELDGPYGEKAIEEIRVMTAGSPDVRGTWEVHVKNDKNEYIMQSSGIHTFEDGIPLITGYFDKTGFMTGNPPLEGLAWLNLAHWQGSSDQKNLMRYIRFPLFFLKGMTSEEAESAYIGPGAKLHSANPEASALMVETTGAGAAAGRQDLLDLEEKMVVLGMQPLLNRPGNQTATGQAIDESKNQSSIQAWIRCLESVISTAFEIAAKWIKTSIPEDFSIDIFNDFGIGLRSTQDIDALLRMRQAGEIDRETFLWEVKRRALLSETTDITDVMEKIESEGPALGDIGIYRNNQ